MESQHKGFKIEDAGLFLHSFCMKYGLLPDNKEDVFMELKNGKWILTHDHAYFYQVQTQLNVCQLPYDDFVVWTKNGMTFERIPREIQFLEIHS